MTRKENWPDILAEQIKAAETRPFSFGEHDCLMFAANVVLAMTGKDVAANLRGDYHDERSAIEALRFFGTLHDVAIACFGEPVDPKFAQRGDVVMLLRDGRESLAICEGARACAPGAQRLEWARMSEALCAWKV